MHCDRSTGRRKSCRCEVILSLFDALDFHFFTALEVANSAAGGRAARSKRKQSEQRLVREACGSAKVLHPFASPPLTLRLLQTKNSWSSLFMLHCLTLWFVQECCCGCRGCVCVKDCCNRCCRHPAGKGARHALCIRAAAHRCWRLRHLRCALRLLCLRKQCQRCFTEHSWPPFPLMPL